MLLVLNLLVNPEVRQRYSSLLRDLIFYDVPLRIASLNVQIDDLNKYSHLIISGSELSVVSGSEYDESNLIILDAFFRADKPILGICYGHQLLARYLASEDVVRRAVTPQFGFRNIVCQKNQLFQGFNSLYAMEAHLDEIYGLPPEFQIIATDNQGVIQAFQYQNKNIWGLQFHPEYDYFQGLAAWERKIRVHPEWIDYFQDSVPDSSLLHHNYLIYRNFIES